MKTPLFFLLALLSQAFLLVATSHQSAIVKKKKLPHATLTLGDTHLEVTVASTPSSREEGLMKKTQLKDNEGMLFVFPCAQRVSFWMKDTPLALSIAYISSNGRILEIHDMEPFSERGILSSSNAIAYTLEVKRNWFIDHGILAGDSIQGLPPLSIAH